MPELKLTENELLRLREMLVDYYKRELRDYDGEVAKRAKSEWREIFDKVEIALDIKT